MPVLDGLRAISILLVLACHMLPLGPKFMELNYAAGAMGMSFFFALSGFLITSTLLHNANIYEFAVKRLTRILPLAYLYTFFVYTFVFFDPRAALWTSTFLINYFDAYFVDGLNAHFWSLCVEMQFYFAVGLVVLLGGSKALWLVIPMCLVITGIRIHEGAYIAIQTHVRVRQEFLPALVLRCFTNIPQNGGFRITPCWRWQRHCFGFFLQVRGCSGFNICDRTRRDYF